MEVKEKVETFSGEGYGIGRIKSEHSDNNYSYVVWCTKTSDCIVIDPNDPVSVLNYIRDRGLSVKYVIDTHCHPDHILGNDPVIKVTLGKILVHPLGFDLVSPRSATVEDGEVIKFGEQEITVAYAPGHTPEHILLLMDGEAFTGDTLFLSGVGNLRHGGVAEDLFNTIETKILTLPDGTRVWPGHDYAEANLRFAVNVEPKNRDAKKKLTDVEKAIKKGADPAPTTIGEEKKYNPFLRFGSPEIEKEMEKRNPGFSGGSPFAVFSEFRRLRDGWK